jgi:DHA1 family bicyclomycin/chloramphenicol resistance-like MFS transporter
MACPIAPGSGAFIALIAALMTVTAMSIDINLPAIPATAADLGSSLTTAQLSVSLFFGGFALGQLVWGPLSDVTGRKPAMLVGLGLYELATLGCALAGDMTSLLVLRVIQGLGAGAGSVLARAVIRDLFEGAQMARILSLALAAFITAPIVAPSIGALILSVAHWRWIFGFLALYGAVLLLLAALFLEESLKTRNPGALRLERMTQAFLAVFRDPASRAWALVVTLTFGSLTVYLTNAAAVLMDGYGMTPTAFGAAFAVVAVFSSAGNLLNSRLIRSLSLQRTIRMALLAGIVLLAAAATIAHLALGGVWTVVVCLGLFFVTFGLVAANATTLALHPHGAIAGSAAAALGFAQTVVPAIVASLVALLYDGSAMPMIAAMLLLSLLAWGIASRAGAA